MQSARPSRRFRKGCLTALAATATAVLALYLLLASGGLEGLVRSLVHRFTSGQDAEVSVYGGASDIFGFTSVDSVVVTNDRGLKVGVYGASVRGSVLGFLLNRSVSEISVDSLVIITPEPSDEPPDTSLAPIFQGTVAGIVTRAGRVQLSYGRIMSFSGALLVDSMNLDASIPSIDTATVDVTRAATLVPGLGRISASGTMMVCETAALFRDFQVSSPPGSIDVSGALNADSTMDFSISGTASTGFLQDLPFASLAFQGKLSGSIPKPLAEIEITEGCLNYDGLLIGITADTLRAGMEECSAVNLEARTGGVYASVSGNCSFTDFAWNGSVYLGLQDTDVSSYFPDLPATSVTGSVSASGNGTGDLLQYFSISGSFNHSRIEEYLVQGLDFSASGNTAAIDGTLAASMGDGTVSSDFSLSLGNRFQPVSWHGILNLDIPDMSVLSSFIGPSLEGATGFSANIAAEGNRSAFSVSGRAALQGIRLGDLAASGLAFDGSLSSGQTGIQASGSLEADMFSQGSMGVSGLSFEGSFSDSETGLGANGYLSTDSLFYRDSITISSGEFRTFLDVAASNSRETAACSLSVSNVSYGDVTADSLVLNAAVMRDGNGISGSGYILADSVLAGDNYYFLESGFTSEPGCVTMDSLVLGAPGDLDLNLSGLFSYGEEALGFSLNGIALTRSGKLRLISAGDIELTSDSSGVMLDTLWLDLPSGEIAADGWFRDDSMSVYAMLEGVDISSLTSTLGLSVPLSGILDAGISVYGDMGDLNTELDVMIDHPTYDQWNNSDSITVSISSHGDSLLVNGIWSWSDGIRSGLRMGFDGIWSAENTLDLALPDVMWLEAELTGVGDELFYLLPMPLKTSGASVSARIEYQRETEEFSAGIASHFNRLYLTNPGIEFPGLAVYMTYPDTREDGSYNGTLTLNSASGQQTTMESTLLLDVREDLSFARGSVPLELRGYDFQAEFTGWETLIAGIGWLKMSGTVASHSEDLDQRPRVTGKINIDAATISMGGGGAIEGSSGSSSSSSSGELPLDLNIRITGERGIWFRTSYANVELSTQIDVTTLRKRLTIGGEVRAVRGAVFLLGREFQITQGEVRILQTTPLGIELDIQAQTRIRSTVSGAEYTITVAVTGDPENPEITLSGTGPSGAISEQDMVTLLTAGMTYGELQQFDSTALGSVAGNYLGQWLARSIRDDVGLDALQFSPDFSSDTTSLVVNAGKYVLPDLFVSYSSDVFSSDAGTVSAQYFINRDFFLEGSTKSTLTGSHDPSLELHYTYRY